MNLSKKKIILFSILISTFLISSTFTTIKVLGYDWNETQTFTLQEDDNIGYGVFDGRRIRENQYLEAEYATDIRYVQLDKDSDTESMSNDSTYFRDSDDSIYYNSFMRFDLDSNEWNQLPTYFQALNNTGTGPNLVVTTGINNQGYLSMNSKTALELNPGIIYIYKVNLVAGKMFDLNFKTTTNLDYYIFLDDILSDSGSANGLTREVYPLVSRAAGDYYIYLVSSNYNYVIIQPQEIIVSKLSADELAAGYFVNEPNEIWNETKQDTEPNKKKETIQAYSLKLSAGTYLFKYIKFNTFNTEAFILTSAVWQTTSSTPNYYDRTIDTDPTTKQLFHFEETTTVVVYIEADYYNTMWVEFDYFFSVNSLEEPILQPGEIFDYDDTFLYYGIQIEETQAVYFNTSSGSYNIWFFNYREDGIIHRESYTLQTSGLGAEKLVLTPGYYFFMRQNEGTYDIEIQFNALASETFSDGNLDFTLNQRNGDSSTLKLIKIVNSDFGYHNYNISLVTKGDYSVEVGHYAYFGDYQRPFLGYSFFRLGYQQDNGTYVPYNEDDNQMFNILSPGEEYVYYLLIDVLAVYNNTGAFYPTYGTIYTDPVPITLRFKEDNGVPEILDSVNINYISASLNEDGSGTISRTFDTSVNDRELYVIQVTAPEYTWYNLKITIVNGIRDDTARNLGNYDGIRDYRVRSHSIWNKYYCLDPYSQTEFVTIEGNISLGTFEVEFGIVDPNLIVSFAVDHTGLNGSIIFEFISHESTLVSETDLGRFPGGGLGLIGSIILGIVGGGLAVAAIVILIVKVIVPKAKGGSSSPPQF